MARPEPYRTIMPIQFAPPTGETAFAQRSATLPSPAQPSLQRADCARPSSGGSAPIKWGAIGAGRCPDAPTSSASPAYKARRASTVPPGRRARRARNRSPADGTRRPRRLDRALQPTPRRAYPQPRFRISPLAPGRREGGRPDGDRVPPMSAVGTHSSANFRASGWTKLGARSPEPLPGLHIWTCPKIVDGYGFGRAGGSWLLS